MLTRKTPLLIPLLALTWSALFAAKDKESPLPQVSPPPPALVKDFELDPFYQKVLLVEGFPIVASKKVPDAALQEAAVVIQHMLKNRADIFHKLAENKIRLSIMAVDERTTDLPEHSDLTPSEFWDRRARGLGATRIRPSVSVGEENLLNNPDDPYNTESIMVHEFAHAIHLMAVNDLDPTFDQRLEKTYESAMARGLWNDKYAAQNSREYFAEGVQSWFGTNREDDHDHNHVNTRKELVEYDPALTRLIAEVFGENDYSYVRSDDPRRQNEGHLKGLDRTVLAVFEWTQEEQDAYDRVSENGTVEKVTLSQCLRRETSSNRSTPWAPGAPSSKTDDKSLMARGQHSSAGASDSSQTIKAFGSTLGKNGPLLAKSQTGHVLVRKRID